MLLSDSVKHCVGASSLQAQRSSAHSIFPSRHTLSLSLSLSPSISRTRARRLPGQVELARRGSTGLGGHDRADGMRNVVSLVILTFRLPRPVSRPLSASALNSVGSTYQGTSYGCSSASRIQTRADVSGAHLPLDSFPDSSAGKNDKKGQARAFVHSCFGRCSSYR
jgi:hypothetical protein